MEMDKRRGDALKREIAAHSDTLLSLDELLSGILRRYDSKNRAVLTLQCNYILSQCEAQTRALERIHEEIAGNPEMGLSDLLLRQQTALYQEYAAVTRGLLETLQSAQAAERSAKRIRQETQARLLELRLRGRKVTYD